MRRALSRSVLSLLAATLAAPVALAEGVVVNGFTGAKKQQIRDRLAAALEKGGTVLIDEAAARVRPEAKASVYAASAKKHDVTAFVDGDVTMKKDGWSVELTVRNGADGEIIGASTLRAPWLPKLLKKIDAEAGTLLEPTLAEAQPAGGKPVPVEHDVVLEEQEQEQEGNEETTKTKAEAKETPAAEEEDDSARDRGADDRKTPKGRKLHALELGVGFGVFSRALEYHQDVNQRLHEYHLPLAPAAVIQGRWYPAAHFTSGVAAGFGVAGEFERSAGVSSQGGAQPGYGTTMQQYAVGVRYRQPLHPVELGASFAYGRHSFTLSGDSEPGLVAANGMTVDRDHVPDLDYQYLRPGLDARVTIGPLHLGVGVGYRAVIGTGDFGSEAWFPHSSAAGVDASLSAGYEAVPGLLVTLGGDVRRYAFDMNAKESDLNEPRDVAGGAVDQYLTGRIGVEWRPGASGQADGKRWTTAKADGRGQRHTE